MSIKLIIALVSVLSLKDEFIGSGSLGKIKLGMLIEEFFKEENDNRIIKKEKIFLEGQAYDIYNVYYNDQVLYAVEPDCADECKIWRIWVYSEKFKTREGIGVGNTLSHIKNKFTITKPLTGEGRVAILVEELSISFLLDSEKIPASWWLEQSLQQLDEHLKIKCIIIS